MASKLSKIEELYNQKPESVLSIIQTSNDGSYKRVVRAPLPDGFGMSVGSAFTDPNNIDLSNHTGGGKYGQILGSAMRLAGQATGFSTRATQNSNVFYAGPEPTEISFDVNFSAYYSAYDEVVIPAAKLMMMGVGSEFSISDINQKVANMLKTEDESVTEEDSSNITKNFGLIRASGECIVRFGNTMTIPRAYVSSVGVKFSNVLDNQGYPMSVDCSVTIKVIRNPTQTEVGQKYFKGIR